MPSLLKTQRIFSGIDYIGNFLNEPVRLGNIYECDDNSFVLLANIVDFIPGLILTDFIETGSKQNLSYSKESSVEVHFGSAGNSNLLKGEVELLFRKKKSGFVSLRDTTISQLKLAALKPNLEIIWNENKYQRNGRHFFVNQVIEAASGTVVFSQESNNRVVLKSTTPESITSVSRLGSGNFEFITNTKATLEIISPLPILPLFKGVYIRPNGKFEVAG